MCMYACVHRAGMGHGHAFQVCSLRGHGPVACVLNMSLHAALRTGYPVCVCFFIVAVRVFVSICVCGLCVPLT